MWDRKIGLIKRVYTEGTVFMTPAVPKIKKINYCFMYSRTFPRKEEENIQKVQKKNWKELQVFRVTNSNNELFYSNAKGEFLSQFLSGVLVITNDGSKFLLQ